MSGSVKWLLSGVAVTGAVYELSIFTSSTTARQQQSAAQQKLQEMLAAVQDTGAELQKSERLAEDLESALASHSQRLESLDSQLAAAREELQRLETVRSDAEKLHAEKRQNLTSLQAHIGSMQDSLPSQRSLVSRLRAEAAMATQHAEDVGARANPLNHPLVQHYFHK